LILSQQSCSWRWKREATTKCSRLYRDNLDEERDEQDKNI
jgi:hypothetical protein